LRDGAVTSVCSSPTARKKLSAGGRLGIDSGGEGGSSTIHAPAAGRSPGHDRATFYSGKDFRDQGAARAGQALGELGATAFGAGGEQDQP